MDFPAIPTHRRDACATKIPISVSLRLGVEKEEVTRRAGQAGRAALLWKTAKTKDSFRISGFGFDLSFGFRHSSFSPLRRSMFDVFPLTGETPVPLQKNAAEVGFRRVSDFYATEPSAV